MGKVLLVTGGARGIGAATARLAAGQGYTLAVNYRADQAAAAALVAAIEAAGGRAVAVQADVAQQDQVRQLFETVEDRLGRLTALVNSAGIDGGPATRVTEFEQAALERLLAVNVIGTMLCCKEAARRMSTREGGAGGAIVNLSSMAATIGGRAGRSAYAASKAAVDAFTVGFAREVAREGIRVNALRPGMTLTDMTDDLRGDPELGARIANTIAMNRCALPDEMARVILFLLSEASSFISGALLDASGGGFMLAPGARP